MALINSTIVLQGDLGEYHEEAPAAAALKPGHLLGMNSSGQVLKQTGFGKVPIWIAKEDALRGYTITDAFASSDVVPYHKAKPGDRLLFRVPALAEALVIGDKLMASGDGTVVKCPSTGGTLYDPVAVSNTITNTTANTDFAFNLSYTIPANFLRAGDRITVRAHGNVPGSNSTDTLIIKLKLGSTTVIQSATVDVANNDVFVIDADILIRAIGTSGSYVGGGMVFIGTPSVVAAATDAPAGDTTGSTAAAINTTTTNALTITAQWLTAHTDNQVQLDQFTITIDRDGGFVPIAQVIAEAVDNSAGADEAFVRGEVL